MIKNFLKNFDKLPISNKSMVYLMWIYGIGSIISGIFINIYIFKLHNSFEEIIFYNIIYSTGTFLGFSLIGWIISILGKDIKNMYYFSYILFILAFIEVFLLKRTLFGVYVFGALYGLGNGMFWNAVYTQELKNIENKNRDFYSSSISAGNNIISIIVPLLVSFIFSISGLFKTDGYLYLFMILPLVYLVSFVFIKNINSYIPNKIKKEDFKNFFNLKKYKYGHLYFLITGVIYGISVVIIPTINIILLKNEVNIGLFQGFLTFISTFLIVHLSHKRQEKNRLKYFAIIYFLLFINYFFFGIFFGLIAFILFSLISLFLNPIARISEHVYDLSLMDNIKTENNDFYPAMLMREINLVIGRVGVLLILLFLLKISKFNIEQILRLGLFLIGFFLIFSVFSIYLWEKNEK